jgi:hypothetical protein
MDSREYANAPGLKAELAVRLHQDILEGRKVLFILEPSCGAELAVLCEQASVLT